MSLVRTRTPASEFAAALGLPARPEDSFRRFAAVAAIVSVLPALASAVLVSKSATLGRWAMVLDMFGRYLLIAPAVIDVGHTLRARSPLWARLFTNSLLAYVLVGAAGAVSGHPWNILEQILAGVGWLGFGWLERTRRPWLGHLSIVLGLSCPIDFAYLVLAPLWAAWVGVRLLREHNP
jgi:hypothetical protein